GKPKRVCVATTHILFNPRSGMRKIAQLRMILERAKSMINEQKMDIPIDSVNVSYIHEKHLSGQIPCPVQRGYYQNFIPEFHESFGEGDITTTVQTNLSSSTTLDVAIDESLGSELEETSEQSQTSITSTTRNMNPVISQPFALSSAYDINASVNRPNSTKTLRGEPFTTYHSSARVVCDFIFYGNLKNTSTTTVESGNRSELQLVGNLELPCDAIEFERSLPAKDFGSDHLSLVSKFRFAK
ncbi:Protein angel 2, partial [Haplosporangium sp. Z 27]